VGILLPPHILEKLGEAIQNINIKNLLMFVGRIWKTGIKAIFHEQGGKG